jgi:magnesium transporter
MAINILSNADSSFKWIDITNPTKDELHRISIDYALHHYTLLDCLEPDHLPKYEDLGTTHFMITRAITSVENRSPSSVQSITTKVAIFYNDTFIITIHRLPIEFIGIIQAKYISTNKCKSTTELVTKITWNVLHTYDAPVIKLSNDIDAYEEKVFLKTLTTSMLEDLYFMRHKAAICNKLLMFTGEVINTIRAENECVVALQDVKDLHIKLSMLYNQAHDDVTNLLNIYLSLSSQKTNEVMKVLTIFSVFFMPLTFIVGVYGMNFKFMPELESKIGYPLVLCTMAIITAIIFWWFKRKRWL